MIQLQLPLTAPTYTTISEKDKIMRYQLMVLKQGITLEAIGLKKRGKSCLSIAKQTLGYPRNTKREEILQALDALIATYE